MLAGEAHAGAGRGAAPLAPPARQRRAEPKGAGLDDRFGFFRLRADDCGHGGFQNPGLLTGYCRDRVAKEGLVIERDWGNRGHSGAEDYVGRVEPPAEPGLEQDHIGGRAGKGEKGRRRCDFEIGDRRPAIGALAFLEQRNQRFLIDQAPVEADAFMEADEMRLGECMHAMSARFEAGAQCGYRRSLAIGAGDVDDRRQPVLRITERRKQPLDAAERQIDQFRVQPAKPLEYPVTLRRGHEVSGIIGTTVVGGCGSHRSPRKRPNVARSSARGTTRSTMPWSRRYSAR